MGKILQFPTHPKSIEIFVGLNEKESLDFIKGFCNQNCLQILYIGDVWNLYSCEGKDDRDICFGLGTLNITPHNGGVKIELTPYRGKPLDKVVGINDFFARQEVPYNSSSKTYLQRGKVIPLR